MSSSTPFAPGATSESAGLEAAARLRPDLDIRIRWRPFLLNPDMPREGMERGTYLIRKFGTEARVRRVYGAISDAGQSVEIDFAFDRIRHTPNSVNSHRLVRLAERYGKADMDGRDPVPETTSSTAATSAKPVS